MKVRVGNIVVWKGTNDYYLVKYVNTFDMLADLVSLKDGEVHSSECFDNFVLVSENISQFKPLKIDVGCIVILRYPPSCLLC